MKNSPQEERPVFRSKKAFDRPPVEIKRFPDGSSESKDEAEYNKITERDQNLVKVTKKNKSK
eukprot:CAMPEP_0168320606 /NCGR_PEP_ID=MMETSP0213-20121227/1778_1 /TAXON_ID=151035 /ORGANISM="Euplotes harpa, Strain FSP1.4" /LENGTH=61 /DNA_ID=CAMNT_0008322103 /DNA_START=219 /DNA_END=404 /DNA_ORIENTATION=-